MVNRSSRKIYWLTLTLKRKQTSLTISMVDWDQTGVVTKCNSSRTIIINRHTVKKIQINDSSLIKNLPTDQAHHTTTETMATQGTSYLWEYSKSGRTNSNNTSKPSHTPKNRARGFRQQLKGKARVSKSNSSESSSRKTASVRCSKGGASVRTSHASSVKRARGYRVMPARRE